MSPYGLSRFGGVRSHIRGLGEALAARGHQVTVIAPGDADVPPASTLGSLPVIRCGTVRTIDFSGTRIDLAWARSAERRAALAGVFDVLHLHTPWNPAIPIQLAVAYRGARVATFHDVPGEATPWWAHQLMPVGATLIRRLLLDATIGVSPAVSTYLGKGTHVVIPNGVEEPPPETPRSSHEAPVVYLGRLEARKDVHTLLTAMAIVQTTGPNETPPVVIAGEGPLRGTLEAQARTLGLRRVTFCGAIDEADKWALLRTARCVVAPSRAGESFGIILLEAMRAGSVPIAADNPGYRHVLEGAADALCFAPGDADALARLIIRAIRDDGWMESMRRWSANHWPRFTWSEVATAVEAVYEQALSRR